MKPNFLLANAIRISPLTQAALVRLAGISSEARLSRIINGYENPKKEEIESICLILKKSANELGLGGLNESTN